MSVKKDTDEKRKIRETKKYLLILLFFFSNKRKRCISVNTVEKKRSIKMAIDKLSLEPIANEDVPNNWLPDPGIDFAANCSLSKDELLSSARIVAMNDELKSLGPMHCGTGRFPIATPY